MTAPLLRFADVTFAYDAQRPLLVDLCLELAAGERLSLIGGNGSGKTTLLHLAVGLLKPRAGTVLAFGRARRHERDFVEVRQRIGLLFQDADDQLFCPTVIDDVAFGPLNLGHDRRTARAIAERTLADLGIAELADRLPHHLSGGEKRLVTLAAVLAMRPEALLLDEPTLGLDEAAEARLLDLLLGLPQAMLIVCHDRAVRRRLATRAVRLIDGKARDCPVD